MTGCTEWPIENPETNGMTASESRIKLDAEDYGAAAPLIEANMMSLIRKADIVPKWLGDIGRFWYRKHTANGSQLVAVDTTPGSRQPEFNQDAVASALKQETEPERLVTRRVGKGGV